eukprot:scaffold21950_cov107-Isochrysis_galbana.AAC.5
MVVRAACSMPHTHARPSAYRYPVVGECLVGRHASGVAVARCVGLGAGRVGSVRLPVFCGQAKALCSIDRSYN